jgi:hypothetical protein
VAGVFVNGHDGDQDEEETFPVDLYEHVIAHEIILIGERTYHVCTRHPAALDALRAGRVPASFTCPLKETSCPMRRLLALGDGRARGAIAGRRALQLVRWPG